MVFPASTAHHARPSVVRLDPPAVADKGNQVLVGDVVGRVETLAPGLR